MSEATASGAALDASVATDGPPAAESRLDVEMAELEAAEARVRKVEANLAGLREDRDAAKARVEALQKEEG